MSVIAVVVNGEPREVPDGCVVAALLPPEVRGVAVAVNGSVVPRSAHGATPLRSGDRVEIVRAVQGG